MANPSATTFGLSPWKGDEWVQQEQRFESYMRVLRSRRILMMKLRRPKTPWEWQWYGDTAGILDEHGWAENWALMANVLAYQPVKPRQWHRGDGVVVILKRPGTSGRPVGVWGLIKRPARSL